MKGTSFTLGKAVAENESAENKQLIDSLEEENHFRVIFANETGSVESHFSIPENLLEELLAEAAQQTGMIFSPEM